MTQLRLPGALPHAFRVWSIRGAMLLLAAAASTLARGEEVFYRLQTEQLICIQKNLQRYLAQPGDELLIAVGSCPDIPANPLLASAVNEGPDIQLLDADAPDTLLAVTRKQLECLAGKAIKPSSLIHRFYPERCRLEAEP